MSIVYRFASIALNDIITKSTIYDSMMSVYSTYLQKLYITYVKMMSSTPDNKYILGPRAFFIYLVQKSKGYTPESLEGFVKELVRNSTIIDTTPTEESKGKHLVALKIFIYS